MKHIKLTNFLFAFLIFLSACNKDKVDSTCDIAKPQENLEWLNYILQRTFCIDVYEIEYNGRKYIGIYMCSGGQDAADLGWVIYNCDGTKYCEFIGFTGTCDCPDGFTKNAKKTLIYHQDEPINH